MYVKLKVSFYQPYCAHLFVFRIQNKTETSKAFSDTDTLGSCFNGPVISKGNLQLAMYTT